MVDKHSQDIRSFNMSRIHSKDTKPELMVRKFLFSCGLRFRKNDKRFPGKPDVVLPKYKTIVLVHGCFWHMHEGCPEFVFPKSNQEFWGQKLFSNHQRDADNIASLEKTGWRVIVVWGCELKKKACLNDRLSLLYKQITGHDRIKGDASSNKI